MKFEIYSGLAMDMYDRHKINVCDTMEEARTYLANYISEHNKDSHYMQVTALDDNHLIYDYGSHTKFYEIVGVNKHIEVVAGIIEHDNKILCMQRDAGKFDYVSFKWEFPGGKVEPGESNEQALKRELKEEMEMDVDILDHFRDVEHVYPDFSIKMYCYEVKAKSKSFVLNVHHDFKWLAKDKLDQLDWAPADQPIVKKLMEK